MSLQSPDYRSAIDFLRSRRKAAGITQQQLAEKLAKPQSYVSKFENFERRLDVAEYVHVARALGLSGKEVLIGSGWADA